MATLPSCPPGYVHKPLQQTVTQDQPALGMKAVCLQACAPPEDCARRPDLRHPKLPHACLLRALGWLCQPSPVEVLQRPAHPPDLLPTTKLRRHHVLRRARFARPQCLPRNCEIWQETRLRHPVQPTCTWLEILWYFLLAIASAFSLLLTMSPASCLQQETSVQGTPRHHDPEPRDPAASAPRCVGRASKPQCQRLDLAARHSGVTLRPRLNRLGCSVGNVLVPHTVCPPFLQTTSTTSPHLSSR